MVENMTPSCFWCEFVFTLFLLRWKKIRKRVKSIFRRWYTYFEKVLYPHSIDFNVKGRNFVSSCKKLRKSLYYT